MPELKPCDRNCQKHKGSVKKVKVYSPLSDTNWGEFNYCDVAIKSDRDAGFRVVEIIEAWNKRND